LKINTSIKWYNHIIVEVLCAFLATFLVFYLIQNTLNYQWFFAVVLLFGVYFYQLRYTNWLFWVGFIPRFIALFYVTDYIQGYKNIYIPGILMHHNIPPFIQNLSAKNLPALEDSYQKWIEEILNNQPYNTNVFLGPLKIIFSFLITSFKNTILSFFIVKLVLIIAEIFLYHTTIKMLDRYKISTKNILWYWANPLVFALIYFYGAVDVIALLFLILSLHYFAIVQDIKGGWYWFLALIFQPLILIFSPILLLKLQNFRRNKVVLLSLLFLAISYFPFYQFLPPVLSFESDKWNIINQWATKNLVWEIGFIFVVLCINILVGLKFKYHNRLDLLKVLFFTALLSYLFVPELNVTFLIFPIFFAVFTLKLPTQKS
jgi:hypothetical protein